MVTPVYYLFRHLSYMGERTFQVQIPARGWATLNVEE
jgi:hypothetical protein